jgi:hypothetical protein
MGLISTIVNIYTARSGIWSITAITTAVVTGGFTTVMMALYLLYDMWLLNHIKKSDKLRSKYVEMDSRGGRTV